MEINPQGLLQDNMYVLGTIHLQSFNGENWDIEVELKATDNTELPLIGDQSTVLTVFFLIFTVYFAMSFLGSDSRKQEVGKPGVHEEDEFLPGNHL